VEIDARDGDDCTPLHVAILNGQLDAMQVILDGGAEVLLTCEGTSFLRRSPLSGCMCTRC
jgi:ankyrin repeat protein